jgi:hypothetical protein
VCDYYGPSDFPAFVSRPGYENHANPTSPESLLLGGTVKEKPDLAKAASPTTHVTADDPPFLIIHGDQDPVVPLQQSELLFTALKSARCHVHFHTIHGAGHGQGFDGPEVLPMVQAFFDQHLAAGKKDIDPTATTTESQSATAANRPGAGPSPASSKSSRAMMAIAMEKSHARNSVARPLFLPVWMRIRTALSPAKNIRAMPPPPVRFPQSPRDSRSRAMNGPGARAIL